MTNQQTAIVAFLAEQEWEPVRKNDKTDAVHMKLIGKGAVRCMVGIHPDGTCIADRRTHWEPYLGYVEEIVSAFDRARLDVKIMLSR